MYLKLLDSIIAEEFQNDRRVYMQSEKKNHNGKLVIDLAFFIRSQINQGWLSKSLGICFRIKLTKGNNSSERL